MTRLLPLIILMLTTFSISEADGRQLSTRVSLGTSGGFTTNTWLNPMLSEWDRSGESGFFTVSPTVNMHWNGTKQTAGVTGMGHLHHLTNERPLWAGGTALVYGTQRLTASMALTASAGISHIGSDYRRDLQWLQGGIDWMAGPFTRVGVRTGLNWRTYSGLEDGEKVGSRYDAWGVEAEHWLGYRWQLSTRFYSSLAHITEPGRGFSFSVAAGRLYSNGLHIQAQTGLDRYSDEFQAEPGRPGQSPNRPPSITYSVEDHFVRTSLSARMPVQRNISLSARFSNLLWISNADNDILPDFEVSAGVDVTLGVFRPASGYAAEVTWVTKNSEIFQIVVRYRGQGPLYLTGDFNDWDEPGIPLERTGRNRYSAVIQAEPGIYQYKILARENGELTWLDLARTTATVDDGFGGRNGRIILEDIN